LSYSDALIVFLLPYLKAGLDKTIWYNEPRTLGDWTLRQDISLAMSSAKLTV